MRSVRFRNCLAVISSCLLLLLMTTPILAETSSQEIRSSSGYDYTLLDDGTAKIIRHNGGEKELTIPSFLDGYSVTALGDCAFQNAGSIESITLDTIAKSVAMVDILGITVVSVDFRLSIFITLLSYSLYNIRNECSR